MQTKDRWRSSLRPRIAAARSALRSKPSREFVKLAGLADRGGRIEVPFLARRLELQLPELELHEPSGAACPEEIQMLLLDYIARADGRTSAGRFLGFRELPDGAFYEKAFRSYTADALAQGLSSGERGFRSAAARLGGEPLSMGDAAYIFPVLPHIALAVVWWSADDEFPARASVLFDETAAQALPIDGLATLGRLLCREILRLADGPERAEGDTMETMEGQPQGTGGPATGPQGARDVEDHR